MECSGEKAGDGQNQGNKYRRDEARAETLRDWPVLCP